MTPLIPTAKINSRFGDGFFEKGYYVGENKEKEKKFVCTCYMYPNFLLK